MARRNIVAFFFIVTALTSLPMPASAAEGITLPAYKGYVNDFARILNTRTTEEINAVCRQVADKTTAQIAIVTINTTRPLTIEEYAVELFERWGIGLKDKDNGVLILASVNERRVRVEVGYGLEGALPDAVCSQVIYQVILPAFKNNDYNKGFLSGTIAIAQLIAKEYNTDLSLDHSLSAHTARPGRGHAGRIFLYLLLFILLFGMRSGLLFFFILGPGGRRRRGYWYGSGYRGSGSSFGGGFGGFGGGFSGGGGASGGW